MNARMDNQSHCWNEKTLASNKVKERNLLVLGTRGHVTFDGTFYISPLASFLKASTEDDFDKTWWRWDSPRMGDIELSAELLVDMDEALLKSRKKVKYENPDFVIFWPLLKRGSEWSPDHSPTRSRHGTFTNGREGFREPNKKKSLMISFYRKFSIPSE